MSAAILDLPLQAAFPAGIHLEAARVDPAAVRIDAEFSRLMPPHSPGEVEGMKTAAAARGLP
jgi:hypothetical protein